jgi:hypothetical protein
MEPDIATLPVRNQLIGKGRSLPAAYHALEIIHGQNPRIRARCVTKSGKPFDLTE